MQPHATSHAAKYQGIKAELRQQIASGKLLPGAQLPTRKELMAAHNCSWATVQRAMNELCLEGIIRSEPGRGTFVADNSTVTPSSPSDQQACYADTVKANIAFTNAVSPAGQPHTAAGSVQVLLMHRVQSVYYSLAQMMDGIKLVAQKMGQPVSYLDAPVDLISRMSLDGYIVVTPDLADQALLNTARERGERFIVLGSDYDESELPCVNADTRGWTRRAVRQLVDAGHQCIGLLGCMPGYPNYQREKQGYIDALLEAGIHPEPSWVLFRNQQAADLGQSINQWLDDHVDATAVFVADYATMLEFTQVAKERKLRIPQDISVIGMDELPSSSSLETPISALAQPFAQLGQRAVERLVHYMNQGEIGGTELLPCCIHHRNSVSAPKPPLSTGARLKMTLGIEAIED